MRSKMMSSRNDVPISVDLSKRRPRNLQKISGKEVSYQYLVEEIVQEAQFTYSPPAEKKSKGMLVSIGSTG